MHHIAFDAFDPVWFTFANLLIGILTATRYIAYLEIIFKANF